MKSLKICSQLFINSLLGSLFVVLLCSCENVLYDYRSAYIGDWEFYHDETTFNIGDSSAYSHSVTTNAGYVEYGESSEEVIIHLRCVL